MAFTPSLRIKIILTFVLTIIAWSSALVFIRIALQGYDPGTLALFRGLIPAFFIIFFYWRGDHPSPLQLRDLPIIFIAGLTGFGLYNFFLNFAEVTVHAGVAGFIIGQIPVVITLLAILFLREKPSKKAWLGLFISFSGVVLIAISQTHNGKMDPGIFYLILAVTSCGIYNVTYKKLLHRYTPIQLTAYGMWIGAASLLFYTPALWREIQTATLAQTCAVLYLGIVPSLIGFMCWAYALRHIPACKAGTAYYALPVMTIFLGWIILGEMPHLLALTGGLIALCGAILVMSSKIVHSKPQAPQALGDKYQRRTS